jgi:hypothetical protein
VESWLQVILNLKSAGTNSGTAVIKEPQMETPLHIDFQGMAPQGHVARGDRAARGGAWETIWSDYGLSRGSERSGQHRRTSGLFEVHIHLSLPDREEVNVGHKPDADERHSNVHSAINDAFKHAQRILEEDVRRMQGDLKTHVPRQDAQTSDWWGSAHTNFYR